MKKYITTNLLLAFALAASAQSADYDAPYFLPGDGVYYVGLPSTLKSVVSEPTLVTQAYQAKFRLFNAEIAAIKAGTKTYNLAERISDDGTELDLVSFMGVGNAYDLTVRNFDGEAYQLGSNAPESSKKWFNTRLLAAQPDWKGHHTLPLAMYDQWDCPISYAPDALLATRQADAVTVSFTNPHEGLVATNVNLPIVCAADCDSRTVFTITLDVWDADHTAVIDSYQTFVALSTLPAVATKDEGTVYSLITSFGEDNIVINTPFDITVAGFAAEGAHAWIPQAIDHLGIYPSHTKYDTAAGPDAVVNLEGYFNYVGTWGWWDGKYERGEVVSSADLVQIYYDPSDPDWPGDYFLGEAGFPLECTFGAQDIIVYDKPDWIKSVTYDESQWEEYGCIQISLSAEALPDDVQGRNGKVVLSTIDFASFYTIYLRQGNAWFDIPNGPDGPGELPDNALPVIKVTGPGYNTQYAQDADGNYLRDEKGQYIRIDQYDSLIDAQLSPEAEDGTGDRVSVLYFWYGTEFANIDYQGGASVTNITTGTSHDIASVSFKTGGDNHHKDVIELRLSTADYIYSEQYHQGVYEVTLPEGIATTSDGRKSGGKTFRFTFGDPNKAYVPVALDLDAYLGNYAPVSQEGEETTGESFTFEKDASGNYSITSLCGSSLRIPVESTGDEVVAKFTENDATGEAFMSFLGSDVTMMFQEYEGNRYIFLDQYALYLPDRDPIYGGLVNFLRSIPVGISAVPAAPAVTAPIYDLQGRRVSAPQKGLYIKSGRLIKE